MADTVQFDLVSPERLLTSVQAREVQIPGAEGDLTAMAAHSPLITTLRPGIVRVISDQGEDEYAVTGGFAEINGDSVSVLAEQAIHRTDLTPEHFQTLIDEANVRLAKARETASAEHPGLVDDAAKLLADMVAMGAHMGLSAN